MGSESDNSSVASDTAVDTDFDERAAPTDLAAAAADPVTEELATLSALSSSAEGISSEASVPGMAAITHDASGPGATPDPTHEASVPGIAESEVHEDANDSDNEIDDLRELMDLHSDGIKVAWPSGHNLDTAKRRLAERQRQRQ